MSLETIGLLQIESELYKYHVSYPEYMFLIIRRLKSFNKTLSSNKANHRVVGKWRDYIRALVAQIEDQSLWVKTQRVTLHRTPMDITEFEPLLSLAVTEGVRAGADTGTGQTINTAIVRINKIMNAKFNNNSNPSLSLSLTTSTSNSSTSAIKSSSSSSSQQAITSVASNQNKKSKNNRSSQVDDDDNDEEEDEVINNKIKKQKLKRKNDTHNDNESSESATGTSAETKMKKKKKTNTNKSITSSTGTNNNTEDEIQEFAWF